MPKHFQLVEFLDKQVGKPYIWGMKTGNPGWDCSGLVHGAFASVGIALPHGSFNQYNVGVRIPVADAFTGCLIFKRRLKIGAICHVAVVIDGVTLIEARGRKWGVVKRRFNPKEWNKLAVKIRELYA